QDAQLRSRQAHAAGLRHEALHALDESGDRVVDLVDVVRLHAQHRIGVLANLGEREPTPSLTLGVELFAPDLTLDFAHFRAILTRANRCSICGLSQSSGRPCATTTRRERPPR